MVEPLRHTVGELVTRYLYHPEMRDLYVEGDRDVSVFQWFFSRLPECDAKVYHINTVDLPRDVLLGIGVAEEGNRGRTIGLSLLLEEALPVDCDAIRCCVDKDLHDFGFSLPICRYLVHTDVACMECYALRSNPIRKLFDVYLGKPISGNELDDMMEILTYVFKVRVAKKKLASSATWFREFTTCCSITNGRIQLDKDAYLAKIQNVSHGALLVDDIKLTTGGFEAFPADRCQSMHGHDIVLLIKWLSERKGIDRKFVEERPLQRSLLNSMEINDLAQEPLFSKLTTWACLHASSDETPPVPSPG